MNFDINPCYDSVQSNNQQKTHMTMNPSYEMVQNSTSDQLQIEMQIREESHYENVNPHSTTQHQLVINNIMNK